MNENLLCLKRQKHAIVRPFWRIFCHSGLNSESKTRAGFSLVEMLLALLVASLLLAALAPVMTRRLGDNVNVSGVGTYERLDYAKAYYEDKEWLVPAGVNIIKVTAVGGGGAGGSATYGYKKFNYTGGVQKFTIPSGIKKIRVYAIAGGGGGASGGDGTNTAYGNIPAIAANTTGNITTAGTYTFANGITPPDTYKVPAINTNCQNSGFTKWTLVSDNSTQLTPNAKITKVGVNGNVNITLSKVTACGGGGGGAGTYGGGGGSGGYVADKSLSTTNLANSINIRVGGGGEAGTYVYTAEAAVASGIGGLGGSDGISRAASGSNGSTGSSPGTGRGNSGGGGGGAATTILSGTTQIFQIGGGGGGGGGTAIGTQNSIVASAGGMGGNGAGTGAGCAGGRAYTAGNSWYATGGGGGGGGASGSTCTAGKNATEGVAGTGGTPNGTNGGLYNDSAKSCLAGNYNPPTPATATSTGGTGGGYYAIGCSSKFAGGGGGGGGMGGKGGRGGNYNLTAAGGYVASSVFASNCSGGNTGSAGLPGAVRLWYSAAGVNNGLKCTYYTTTNAGGGGGTGQIWIGEVDVTPGETLSVNIGKGGNGATSKSSNGSNGGNTTISGSTTGSIITLIGGNGGNYSASGSTGGVSGGCSTQKPWKNWTGLNVFDASNQTNLSNIGNGSVGGKAGDNNFTGGKGGQTYNIENTVLEGGIGGAGNNNGNAPSSTSYGTGGGGGGGNANVAVNTAGLGGNGANGYVYIEWGEGSGGGGQSGQVVIDSNVWVSGGASKVKMIIGKGGTPKQDTSVNWSGFLGAKGNKGGDTIVMVDNEVVLTAKGGYGGNGGATSNGRGGGNNSAAETISNTVPGEDGTSVKGGAGASLIQSIFPLLGTIDKISSVGGLGGSISTSGEGKAGSGYGAGGGGGMFLNNRAYQGGKGSDGMVYIEYKN